MWATPRCCGPTRWSPLSLLGPHVGGRGGGFNPQSHQYQQHHPTATRWLLHLAPAQACSLRQGGPLPCARATCACRDRVVGRLPRCLAHPAWTKRKQIMAPRPARPPDRPCPHSPIIGPCLTCTPCAIGAFHSAQPRTRVPAILTAHFASTRARL
jgi:hypothetical protein